MTTVNFRPLKDISTIADSVKGTTNLKVEPRGGDFYTELVNFQERILNSNKFSPRDLILYQIKAGQFGLRLELLSKFAESMLTTVRKLQSN